MPRRRLPEPISEAFNCPHCGKHIYDAALTRYVAKRALSRRTKTKPVRFSTGRPRTITDAMIDDLRHRRSKGAYLSDLARHFAISVAAASRIVNRTGCYAHRGSKKEKP